MSYYNKNAQPNIRVNFKLLDDNGCVIRSYSDEACFSNITYYAIPKRTAAILIHHSKDLVPYDVSAIERWINDLNEIGFPCAYIGSNAVEHNFQINIKDYKYKVHFISTLMLIRALYESGICMVPDIYFQLVDANPTIDKFDALQTAHKPTRSKKEFLSRWYNTNHMVTYDGNGSGENVKKDTLFERYKDSKLDVLHGKDGDYFNLPQSPNWQG